MTTARYFQDELDHLRRAGDEFAREYPQLTKYLSSRSTDPDVERLLEGFAFLTSRLREKIDDQLPEVTQSLLMLLWPNFLRPIPSMCIMEYAPIPGAITEVQRVPAGSEVLSVPVDGTICRFRLSSDLEVAPLRIDGVRHELSRAASVVTISLSTLTEEPIRNIGLKRLRLHLAGAAYGAQSLNLWLHRYLRRATLGAGDDVLALNPADVRPVGLGRADAILPYPENAFSGYRLLQEFFALPEKFAFVDITIPTLAHLPAQASQVELMLEFDRPLPPDVRVDAGTFRLHCAPAINLFPHDAEPILLDGKRTEYPVLPARLDGSEIEVYSIDEVTGWLPAADGRSGGISRVYERFESFTHEIERVEGRMAVYFREKVRQHIAGTRLDRQLSFQREDEAQAHRADETISLRLTCANGGAPTFLGVGDICRPTREVPSFVIPSNVTRPTQPSYPLVDGTLQWQLISALSLNYLSLQDPVALRNILMAFDFPAKVDMQRERGAKARLEGIESLASERVDRLFRGLPVRGMRSTLRMRESRFACEGEMFLFASVLAEFFALYATVNSFHELVVRGIEQGEEYRWPARIGNQPLI